MDVGRGRKAKERKEKIKNNWRDMGLEDILKRKTPKKAQSSMIGENQAIADRYITNIYIPLSTIHGPARLSTSSIRKLGVGGGFQGRSRSGVLRHVHGIIIARGAAGSRDGINRRSHLTSLSIRASSRRGTSHDTQP